jgi:hypothetical protein
MIFDSIKTAQTFPQNSERGIAHAEAHNADSVPRAKPAGPPHGL